MYNCSSFPSSAKSTSSSWTISAATSRQRSGAETWLSRAKPGRTGPAVPNLDLYYEDCVIGGPGFVITIKEPEQFKEATRNKLVQEIAAVPTKPQIVPVQAKPRVYCS
jgi:hypothetical protein